MGENFSAFEDSVVNISVGSIGEVFLAFQDSEINFLGIEFFLNGELLDELLIDELFTIDTTL